MPDPSWLTTAAGHRLAYHRTEGMRAGGGFPRRVQIRHGGHQGALAGGVGAHAGPRLSAVRLFGHGQSSGAFTEGCIGDWAADARAALEALTEGPQILIGSSMGGWIALLLAQTCPERVASMVTIAAAPDFTEDAIWAGFDAAQRHRLMTDGQIALPSDYGEPYIITRRLIEDGRDHLVLRTPLDLPFPVRFLQGTADEDVDKSVALRILDHATGPDMRLTLVRGADHRFSDPDCLGLIGATLDEVSTRAGTA